LMGLRVRIPLGVWVPFSCKCCILSGRGLCVALITSPEESYRMWCVQWGWSRRKIITENRLKTTPRNKIKFFILFCPKFWKHPRFPRPANHYSQLHNNIRYSSVIILAKIRVVNY
jgi:hypothetical protein